MLSKLPPPLECVEETSIYRQNVARFFNLVPQLLSFFVNFDFSYFLYFFKNKQYQRRLNEENQ